MESAVLSVPFFTISRTLNGSPTSLHRNLSKSPLSHILRTRVSSPNPRFICNSPGEFQKSKEWLLMSFAGLVLQNSSPAAPLSRRLACISSSPTAFSSVGGGDGTGGGNGGGSGGGWSNGGEAEMESVAAVSDEVSAPSPDVIILDVSGMTCGGCAASVKRILESQPQVSSASVNLATETAVVWVVPEVKVTQNWQQQLGERLAEHLTSCGFKSKLRGRGQTIEGNIHEDTQCVS